MKTYHDSDGDQQTVTIESEHCVSYNTVTADAPDDYISHSDLESDSGNNIEKDFVKNTLTEHAKFYPEGGYGWVVLVGTFFVSYWTLGVALSWGVFQAYFIRNQTFPEANPWKLYWVGSIACSSIFIASPAIASLITKIGTRAVLITGTTLTTIAYIAGSFATQYWHFYLTVSLLFGIGGCFCYFTSLTVLAEYFYKKRGLVVAIALTGTGIGSTAMAPLFRLMLSKLGFRWTMRILGGCMLFFLGLASFLIRPYKPSTIIAQLQSPSQDSKNHESGARRGSCDGLDMTLLQNFDYMLVLIATVLYSLTHLVPYLLVPSYAISIDLSATQGALMVSIASSIGLVSRIVVGIISDSYGSMNSTVICGLATSICYFVLWLRANSFTSLVAFVVAYGLFGGPSIMLYPVSATRVAPASQLTSALGFVFLAHAFGYLLGAPLAQLIVAKQGGSYNGVITLIGSINVLSVSLILVVRIRKSNKICIAL